jgi:FkbM family methyltransferase
MNRRLKAGLRSLLPRTISERRILGGPLRGRSLVTSWHDYPAAILGRTELALLGWFSANVRNGETWLDIGAHYGYTALALCQLVGGSGRVFAFEPMIGTAGCVSRTRASNGFQQLTVVPIGLGECGDLATRSLPVVRGMVDSTLDGAQFEERFLASSLDWLWPRLGGTEDRIDGVKIDVQGMEIQVLKGMRGILRQHRPKLAIELHRGVSRDDFLDLLGELGYSQPALPIEPLPGESTPQYSDDRSYAFLPDTVLPGR